MGVVIGTHRIKSKGDLLDYRLVHEGIVDHQSVWDPVVEGECYLFLAPIIVGWY